MDRVALIKNLFSLQDIAYQQMQIRLLPTVSPDQIIGVRTPALRQLANEFGQDEDFLNNLPHAYFEENQIHSFIISSGKDFDATISKVNAFLPFVDNWATCDQLTPKVFKKHHPELLEYIKRWIQSDSTYTVRFAVKMLMDHFLDEDFSIQYPEMVASVHHEDYYVRMVVAWYFATAAAKQYDSIYPYFAEKRLEKWIHNKAIQKSIESFRVSDAHKTQLKTLRIK